MATIGYLEGTDPELLTTLNVDGHDTLPLGNGTDSHGKFLARLTEKDGVDIVVTYFHKLKPIEGEPPMDRMLSGCRMNDISIIVLLPDDVHEEVQTLLGEAGDCLTLVDPSDALAAIKGEIT